MEINKMVYAWFKSIAWLGLVISITACEPGGSPKPKLFSKVSSRKTHIYFNNEIRRFETDSLNALEYDPLFNGGGIGIGDFNNDGLQDIFFSGNLVSSKFYINLGDFRFEDVTLQSGLATQKWCTGVSVSDVNLDGRLDIYVCVAGKDTSRMSRANLLFINQGNVKDNIPVFKEMSSAYGLDDSGFSIQSAFFDYDRDNDLDCYVLTNAIEKTGRNRIRPKRMDGTGASNDRLYQNVGMKDGHPVFQNVNAKAGILKDGYGLGLCIADLNQDDWLDIYCANDFVSNDLIWINNHDGTFTDHAADYLKHTSYNSMGVDVQDFNNDGLPDICVVDMLPEAIERRKMMVIKTSWEFFRLSRQMGYQDQYVRNVLQLNQGKNRKGDLKFSEIGQLAGVCATDWSWAPLLADMDNDGNKDLLVSTGYRRDITNLDYVVYLNQEAASYKNQFSPEARKKMIESLYKLPEVKLHNYIYRNKGDLTFEDKSIAWGLDEKTYSNGAVYADLDNDGDLDLVFNNIDDEAGLYRNEIGSKDPAERKEMNSHYLRLKLMAEGTLATGAKVSLTLQDGKILYQENLAIRGYMSSVEPIIHFGLGSATSFMTEIVWSNGERQIEQNLHPDRTHIIHYTPPRVERAPIQHPQTFFTMLDNDSCGLQHKHTEYFFDEFRRTPSLPHQFNKNSPGIAIGDADGNGMDDIFIGADPGKDRTLFLQKVPGKFSPVLLGKNDMEDMGAIFFDADKDGDQDLYVVSGGSLYTKEKREMYQDRLYLNDGSGKLSRSQNLLPDIRFSGSVAVAADFDRDGDLDIFRGSRVCAGEYPNKPVSYLLLNNGKGKFENVTTPELERIGMVTTALWSDYNNDGWFDLIIAGEFMPICFFRNTGGKLQLDKQAILNSSGWWNSIAAGDFDQDGDMDYIAGNLGLNTRYKATDDGPVKIYAADYDHNGSIDPVTSYFKNGKEYAVAIRDVMVDQITLIMRKRFVSYSDYANAGLSQVLTDEERSHSQILSANEMQSCYLENDGGGKFRLKHLPMEAQFSPVFGIIVQDYNNDGFADVLLAGNSYSAEPYTGWYDSSFGLLLLGDGKGNFLITGQKESGLYLDHDAKAMAEIFTGKENLVIVTNNDGPLEVLRSKTLTNRSISLSPADAWAMIKTKGGKTQKIEFTYGSGYLSQSSRVLNLSDRISEVTIYDFFGKTSVTK